MILEKLEKLNGPKRISAAVLIVLVTVFICYYLITRGSVMKLREARAKHARIYSAYAGTENQRTDFLNLQRQLEEGKRQIKEQREECFSREQASQFFENITTLALTYNLQPISRITSESKKPVLDEKTEPEQQFLETQWAKVTFAGNYFDIVDFVSELTDRPQKVCITDLHVFLPPGETLNPTASFKVMLLIDSSRRKEK